MINYQYFGFYIERKVVIIVGRIRIQVFFFRYGISLPDTSFLGESDPGQLNPDIQPWILNPLDPYIMYVQKNRDL